MIKVSGLNFRKFYNAPFAIFSTAVSAICMHVVYQPGPGIFGQRPLQHCILVVSMGIWIETVSSNPAPDT